MFPGCGSVGAPLAAPSCPAAWPPSRPPIQRETPRQGRRDGGATEQPPPARLCAPVAFVAAFQRVSPQSHQEHKEQGRARQEDGAEGLLHAWLCWIQAVTLRLLRRLSSSRLLGVLGDFVVKSPGRRPPCGREGLRPSNPNTHPPTPTETTPAAARLRTGLARRCFRFLACLSLSPTGTPEYT